MKRFVSSALAAVMFFCASFVAHAQSFASAQNEVGAQAPVIPHCRLGEWSAPEFGNQTFFVDRIDGHDVVRWLTYAQAGGTKWLVSSSPGEVIVSRRDGTGYLFDIAEERGRFDGGRTWLNYVGSVIFWPRSAGAMDVDYYFPTGSAMCETPLPSTDFCSGRRQLKQLAHTSACTHW